MRQIRRVLLFPLRVIIGFRIEVINQRLKVLHRANEHEELFTKEEDELFERYCRLLRAYRRLN